MNAKPKRHITSTARVAVLYAAVTAASALVFLFIRARGANLVPQLIASVTPTSTSPAARASTNAPGEILVHVLLATILVILVARAVGAAFKKIGQPPVIGEMVAGIVLGPSVFGRVAPDAWRFLLPQTITPFLGILSQIGVILFMFLVGMELDTSVVRKRTRVTIAVSHGSIVVPFLLGAALALWLYPRGSYRGVPFTVFALFIGVAMSVTAFPVLARILTDRGISTTPLGVLSLSCAAVGDLTAWCLLALVVSVARSEASGAAQTIGLVIGYVALMLLVVRPIVARASRSLRLATHVGDDAVALVLVGLMASALATEAMGVHALFGAFLLGAIIPHDSPLAHAMTQKLESLVVVFLLPIFFAVTGLRTQIGLVHGAEAWGMCAVVVLVACVGKFGGASVAARLCGLGWRDSASLGVLMNTRGLMELVVLTVGLDLGVITPSLFAIMVIMALVTTFATTPLFQLIQRVSRAKQQADLGLRPDSATPEKSEHPSDPSIHSMHR